MADDTALRKRISDLGGEILWSDDEIVADQWNEVSTRHSRLYALIARDLGAPVPPYLVAIAHDLKPHELTAILDAVVEVLTDPTRASHWTPYSDGPGSYALIVGVSLN